MDILELYPEYTDVTEYPPNSDGRYRVRLFNRLTRTQSIKQRSRVLLEVLLGRRLLDDETVDHIDEDPTNDNWYNLQPLSLVNNAKRSAIKIRPIFEYCIECNTYFELSVAQRYPSDNTAGPFCSRRCSGINGKRVQDTGIKSGRLNIVREYYK